MNEFELFEEIKKRFTVEKGKLLIVELSSGDITKCGVEVFENIGDGSERTDFYIANKVPYAVFDYLSEDYPCLFFCGQTFHKDQSLVTGQTSYFNFYDNKKVTAQEIKRDLFNLESVLRNTKAS